jgi:hypothetical protein
MRMFLDSGWQLNGDLKIFAFNQLPVNFKFGRSPIATWYFTSVLLTNCHTCYYESKASVVFECNPPTRRRYLGFKGTAEEEREFDRYLELLVKPQPAE